MVRTRWGTAVLLAVACGDDSGSTDASATGSASASMSAGTLDGSSGDADGSATQGMTSASSDGSEASSVTADGSSSGVDSTGSGGTSESGGSSDSGASSDSSGSSSSDGGSSDSGGGSTTGVIPGECEVVDDMNGVGDCTDEAPPDAFEPETQWDFLGPPGFEQSIVTPLVANMTDDNGDGEIDLCDVPDVIAVAGPWQFSDTPPARIYVLDGETGVPHFDTGNETVQWGGTPAFGDIDGDGLPEIVTSRPNGAAPLVAFEHDGTFKWQSAANWNGAQASAVALADIDTDGDVEIIAGANVFDHTGALVWSQGNDQIYSASAVADLDGDGSMEVLTANAVYHADGMLYWNVPGIFGWAHPSVADLDDDDDPEVLYAVANGVMLFEHDGTVIWGPIAPTGPGGDWNRPINVHNYDLVADAEFGAAEPSHYAVYDPDGMPLWVVDVADPSGQSGGTAFDFIGSGVAQAIYMDETTVYVFDDMGQTLMSIPYKSGTIIEYPTVADIDNDGSAEILVVSNSGFVGGPVDFTVRAVRDIEDRWVQARRIWNQHTYHVTNVREDGTIPQNEPKHWTLLNTFRTQAQIEGGGLCLPDPQ